MEMNLVVRPPVTTFVAKEVIHLNEFPFQLAAWRN
jgi:hypothetical protein